MDLFVSAFHQFLDVVLLPLLVFLHNAEQHEISEDFNHHVEVSVFVVSCKANLNRLSALRLLLIELFLLFIHYLLEQLVKKIHVDGLSYLIVVPGLELDAPCEVA